MSLRKGRNGRVGIGGKRMWGVNVVDTFSSMKC